MKRLLTLALVVCASTVLAQNAALMPVAKQTFLDANGIPLSGGLLYTCVAGASCAPSFAGDPPLTPLATYTDSTAATPNANPIVLDSAGRAGVWLGAGSYKIVLQDATGGAVWTQDGVTSLQALKGNGVNFLSYTASGTGAVTRTVASKLGDVISVKDFGAKGDAATNDTTSFQAAVDSGAAEVYVPIGTYLVNGITVRSNLRVHGAGNGSIIKLVASAPVAALGRTYASPLTNLEIDHLQIDGNKGAGWDSYGINATGSYISVHDTYIHDAGEECIAVGGTTSDSGTVRIVNNTCVNPGNNAGPNRQSGIGVSGGPGFVITGNVVTNTQNNEAMICGIDAEPNVGTSYQLSNLVISENVIVGGSLCANGASAAHIQKMTLSNNIVYASPMTSAYEPARTAFQVHYVDDLDIIGNKIYNNNNARGLWIEQTSHCNVKANTIHQAATNAVSYPVANAIRLSFATYCNFDANDIISASGVSAQAGIEEDNVTSDYNVYTNTSSYQVTTPIFKRGTHSVIVDPNNTPGFTVTTSIAPTLPFTTFQTSGKVGLGGAVSGYSSTYLKNYNNTALMGATYFGCDAGDFTAGCVAVRPSCDATHSCIDMANGSALIRSLMLNKTTGALYNAIFEGGITAPSGNGGYSGTKVAGSCTLTISGGIITNVTGC